MITVQAEALCQAPLFASETARTSTVFVAEFGCLACGDTFELKVAALAALPSMPARCARCRGSVLVVSTTTRVERYAGPIDWHEGMPKRGRPLAHPRIQQQEK